MNRFEVVQSLQSVRHGEAGEGAKAKANQDGANVKKKEVGSGGHSKNK